jgi:hypothetical protein
MMTSLLAYITVNDIITDGLTIDNMVTSHYDDLTTS